uniref:Uncharacterized protein n=1 Tax=Onchocerca volvulus TaxID=6282 RepID=A0A8R1TT17_ONCVO
MKRNKSRKGAARHLFGSSSVLIQGASGRPDYPVTADVPYISYTNALIYNICRRFLREQQPIFELFLTKIVFLLLSFHHNFILNIYSFMNTVVVKRKIYRLHSLMYVTSESTFIHCCVRCTVGRTINDVNEWKSCVFLETYCGSFLVFNEIHMSSEFFLEIPCKQLDHHELKDSKEM